MNPRNVLNQQLETMIEKQNRCQDWVQSHSSAFFAEQNWNKDDSTVDWYDASDKPINRKKPRLTKNDEKDVNLCCEWEHCSYVENGDIAQFRIHVSGHISDLRVVEKENKKRSYLCLWEECNFDSSDSLEITRHVNHHAYHTRLKSSVSELHLSWNFPACKLDNDNRNILPELPRSFLCEWTDCDNVFENYESFLQHIQVHISRETFGKNRKHVPCPWKACQLKFNEKCRLRLHMKTHTGEKTAACPTCGALFSTNTKYMDHCIRKVSVTDMKCQCKECWRHFPNERLLKDHKRYHTEKYKCTYCSITCSTPSKLASHVLYRHLENKFFACKICNYKGKTLEDYNSHMTVHDSSAQYKCNVPECGFFCRSFMTLKKHLRKVHLSESEALYCCHLCDNKYQLGTSLSKHLKNIHQLEKPKGHSRWRYKEDEDGFFRLKVEKYQVNDITPDEFSEVNNPDMKYIIREENPNGKCYAYNIEENSGKETDETLTITDEGNEFGTINSTVEELTTSLVIAIATQ